MSLNYTTGPISETEAAWTRTLEVAESLDDVEYQLRALRGLWAHRMNAGEYRASLAIAYKFGELAATAGDPAALGAADRMAGIILHYLGDQTGARQHLERRLARTGSPVDPVIRFLIDQRVAARSLLARNLWLQGFPDQAATTARLAVDEAETKPRRPGWRDGGGVEPTQFPRGDYYEQIVADSVFGYLRRKSAVASDKPSISLRRRLAGPEAQLDFPVLAELAAHGATDYIAELVGPGSEDASRGDAVAYSFATDRSDGFSDDDIATLRAVLLQFRWQ